MRISNRLLAQGTALVVLSLIGANAVFAGDKEQHAAMVTEKGPNGHVSVGVTARDRVGVTGVSVGGQSENVGGRIDVHTDGSARIEGAASTRGGTTFGAGVGTDSRGNANSVDGHVTMPWD